MKVQSALLASSFLIAGCSSQSPNPASSVDHPANAGAPTTALPSVGMEKDQTMAVPANSKVTSSGEQAAVYTCPMHPEVISDKPGKCPKCGMNLVLKGSK